jgi:biopolymer transport protein ExbB
MNGPMTRPIKPLLVFLLVLAATPLARADAGLDALLQQIQASSTRNAQADAARVQRFLAHRDEQAALTQKAEAQLADARKHADELKARYDAGAQKLAALKKQVGDRSGDYAQVFAAARQAAGDFRAQTLHTMVTAQYPQRLAFLDSMATGAGVPSLGDLEQLWFTLMQEMTATGESTRFTATVLTADGTRTQAPVVRVGPFVAFSGGRYLTLTADGALQPLSRQPGGAARSARAFAAAETGFAPALIDPTRGQLLQREAERPDLLQRIRQGGIVGYIIIALGLLGFGMAIYQFVYLFGVGTRVRRQLATPDAPRDDNPLGRVLAALGHVQRHAGAVDAELLETRLTEAVLREVPALERFQSLLRLIVAAGPLLGLVGTVSGMIMTFQVITELGAGDPKVMAGGISQAMIATVLGLGVAIPLLFVNSVLTTRSRALVQVLEEQAAGMLARQLEAQQ